MGIRRALLLVATQFLILHGTDGQTFYVNPALITSLRGPIKGDLTHFPQGTRCVIVTADGKFLAVRDSCAEVRGQIEKGR